MTSVTVERQRHPAAQRPWLPDPRRVRDRHRGGGHQAGSLTEPPALSVKAGQPHIGALLTAAVLLAGCGGTSDNTAPQANPATTAATTTTSASATTKQTTTSVSERLAHWQEVVKSMKYPELADLEQKRMAVAFADQAESLVAVHDRQAELHC